MRSLDWLSRLRSPVRSLLPAPRAAVPTVVFLVLTVFPGTSRCVMTLERQYPYQGPT